MSDRNTVGIKRLVKLSIITQFYPPDFAATGQLIEELVAHLGRQGMQIQVFTGQPGYAFRKEAAQPVEQSDKVLIRRSRSSQIWPHRIRGKAVSGLLFCLRSGLHLLKNSARGDILLLTTAPPYLAILGYLAKLCFDIPYVCLVYDLYPDIAVQLKVVAPHHWLVRCWDLLNQCIWKQAQEIIVLSPTMKQRIAAKCPQVANRIAVIHSWADPNWIVPLAKQDNWFANQHNLVATFNVLYSGNLGRCHDLETVLEAAQQLQNEPIRFVFIGDGAKRQACIDQVNHLGLTNCLFLPYQEKQFLPYSLTACDLSIVSMSPGMEGLVAPSKLYGVLAAERPVAVICEPHSYLRQILVEARCGQAFENGAGVRLAEFIHTLAKDPQLAQRLGKAGRRYLKAHFTPEIIAQQYWQVLSRDTAFPSPQPTPPTGLPGAITYHLSFMSATKA
ncbi:MAG TPA: glycosyltransferase family 4 protein, partial [Candidatus Caenarcaniphilales bacterium]